MTTLQCSHKVRVNVPKFERGIFAPPLDSQQLTQKQGVVGASNMRRRDISFAKVVRGIDSEAFLNHGGGAPLGNTRIN